MCACLLDGHKSAHLTAVHAALAGLTEDDQVRLGVLASWKSGPHTCGRSGILAFCDQYNSR